MSQPRVVAAALIAVPLCLVMQACEKPSSPPAAQASPPAAAPVSSATPETPAATPAGTAGTVSAAGVTFKLPAGWKAVTPSNQMRIAEVQVPDASGDPAKACVIAFSTAGGDVQANISRWAGQMLDASGQPPKTDIVTRDVGGLKVHTVSLKGAYQGMGETPRPDWALHGAIVETGPTLLFVKMTGPASAMDAARPGWDSMIESATRS